MANIIMKKSGISISNAARISGIPSVISTVDNSDDNDDENSLNELLNRIDLAIDPNLFDKSSKDKDESTADETTCEDISSGPSSPGNGSQDDDDNDNLIGEDNSSESDEDSDNDDASVRSHKTNDSTRFLLQQAQRRMHHQSVYEEVKSLRTDVSRLQLSLDSALSQKTNLLHKCRTLEEHLAEANETMHQHKLEQIKWADEKSQRELEYMNQLAEMCGKMEQTENTLMEEIMKRDAKIIDLQNLWNESEIERMNRSKHDSSSREKKNMEEEGDVPHAAAPAAMKKEVHEEETMVIDLDDDDSWSEECSSDFI